MKTYKVLPIILSIGLFGCGNANNTNNNTTTAETTTAPVTESTEEFTSKLPDSAPVIKIGTDANYAPYEYKDQYGNVIGFDIELMQHIGEDQGFKVEIYNDPWKVLFDNIDNKNRDMIAAGLTYSEERASKYLLSKPYAPLPTTLVYLNDELNIKSLNDLDNVRIGILVDSEPYEFFAQGNYKIGALKEYPTTFAAVQAMAQDEVDAVADDSGVIRYIFSELPSLTPKYFEYENIGTDGARKVFLVDKNQPDLLKKVNAGLEEIKKDGTYATLTKKWFGEDLTEASLQQEKLLSTS